MASTRKPILPDGKHVLVTGASSGLGKATVLHLARQGFRVIAGVRAKEAGAALVAEDTSGRIEPVILDVTDESAIAGAASRVAEIAAGDGLWGLVNNAGICISAPLELVSSDLLRRQLEINVVGQLAVTRAFLPLLRRAGSARIVNVTSGLGTVAIPYLGAYSAAQFAKEGVSDALRRELAPWGIAVSVVSPGAIWTPIWNKISEDAIRAVADAPADVSKLYRDTFLRFLQGNEQGARDSKTTPADVAAAIHDALTSSRPRTRYRVGKDVRRGAFLAWLLPDTVVDGMFKQIVTPAADAKEVQHVQS